MRESPQANQMKARELFLEVHRPKIVSDYQLPHDDLHFDNTITELIFGGIFVGEAIFDHLNQEGTVSNLIAIKNEHRERLLKSDHLSIEGYREKWERHLDYESLIMDKMMCTQWEIFFSSTKNVFINASRPSTSTKRSIK